MTNGQLVEERWRLGIPWHLHFQAWLGQRCEVGYLSEKEIAREECMPTMGIATRADSKMTNKLKGTSTKGSATGGSPVCDAMICEHSCHMLKEQSHLTLSRLSQYMPFPM